MTVIELRSLTVQALERALAAVLSDLRAMPPFHVEREPLRRDADVLRAMIQRRDKQ